MDRMWRDLVIEKGRVPTAHEDMFQCFYCGGTFTDTAIVADHVLPKGRFQILRYCISNGCPSCVQCNQSDNKYKRLKEKGLTERQLFNELRDNEYQVVFQRYSQ